MSKCKGHKGHSKGKNKDVSGVLEHYALEEANRG